MTAPFNRHGEGAFAPPRDGGMRTDADDRTADDGAELGVDALRRHGDPIVALYWLRDDWRLAACGDDWRIRRDAMQHVLDACDDATRQFWRFLTATPPAEMDVNELVDVIVQRVQRHAAQYPGVEMLRNAA